ncbi:hypothetical protein BDZ45DRAFT_799622 [Acephala macrosclerotiorum]|nr:hypothetical protein BDZ45DRAFT_799622 [Acephala macrosclerotiorum]
MGASCLGSTIHRSSLFSVKISRIWFLLRSSVSSYDTDTKAAAIVQLRTRLKSRFLGRNFSFEFRFATPSVKPRATLPPPLVFPDALIPRLPVSLPYVPTSVPNLRILTSPCSSVTVYAPRPLFQAIDFQINMQVAKEAIG